MWELPRKLDNNKTYSKIDDRQKGRELPFYEKFKMNISVEVLRPALTQFSFGNGSLPFQTSEKDNRNDRIFVKY
ncbi:hypothetical protein [Leptospira borgpetersenii]|nr:hypothetical protein [Leptospira borgpetersenii]